MASTADVERLRRDAASNRQIALHMTDALIKKKLNAIADGYERLARQIEELLDSRPEKSPDDGDATHPRYVQTQVRLPGSACRFDRGASMKNTEPYGAQGHARAPRASEVVDLMIARSCGRMISNSASKASAIARFPNR
jgi:hypothetical protein